MGTEEKDRIPPEKAMEILKQGGLEADIEQTKEILGFLYKLADIVLRKYFDMPP